MGKLILNIGVGDQQGNRSQDVQVNVGTGSTFTAVPRRLPESLEVPVARQATSRRPTAAQPPSTSAGPSSVSRTKYSPPGSSLPRRTNPASWESSPSRKPCLPPTLRNSASSPLTPTASTRF